MTDNRDQVLIAVILIFSGLIFLGETLGKYNFNFIFFLRSYWPLILIIFGFHILLQKTKYWLIVPLITAALFIYLIYLLFNERAFYFIPQFKMRFFEFDQFPFRK